MDEERANVRAGAAAAIRVLQHIAALRYSCLQRWTAKGEEEKRVDSFSAKCSIGVAMWYGGEDGDGRRKSHSSAQQWMDEWLAGRELTQGRCFQARRGSRDAGRKVVARSPCNFPR